MSTDSAPSGRLHLGLWAVQLLLAFAFGMAGLMKLTTSDADLLAAGMTWVERFPSDMRLLIGGAEVLGAIGLVAPAATGIQPRLTAAAAVGLVVVMGLAALDHAVAGELGAMPPSVVLGGLAAFVAWGREKAAPIPARS